MKKKTAILVDAEWFRKMLRQALRPKAAHGAVPAAAPATGVTAVGPAPLPALGAAPAAAAAPPIAPAAAAAVTPLVITAEMFYRNACLALDPAEEEILRFFCYDCEPFDKPQRNPIDKSWIKFGKGNPMYTERMRFFEELGAMKFVALRRGVVKGRDWEIKEAVVTAMLDGTHPTATLAAGDIRFGLEQKGVDMRIGMDFATLSLKRLVERIILISGDTDMVPAIKLARREGIQVCVVQVGTHGRLAPSLIEDSDLVRRIAPAP